MAALREDALELLAHAAGCLERVAPIAGLDVLIQQSTGCGKFDSYNARPELRETLAQIAVQFGIPTQSRVMQALLARLALDFQEEALDFRVTRSVRGLYAKSLSRILKTPVDDWHLDDRFFKDLALLSGHLFPVGERVVEPCSALQRSLFYRSGVGQALHFVRAVAQSGGFRPVFRLHVHLSEASRLSADSWQQACMHTVELLAINPRVKGVVGASWFYDPKLPEVSPHLSFINGLLRPAGAHWFFSHAEGKDSGALAKSVHRRSEFDAERYIPRCYVVFWPRQCALAWLDRIQASQ